MAHHFEYRGIAQLVEQRSPKPRAEGSSPSAPAIKKTPLLWCLFYRRNKMNLRRAERVEGCGSPVETSAKQKHRPSRQARPSPSAPAIKKHLLPQVLFLMKFAFRRVKYLLRKYRANFISLSAPAENFTIHRIISYFPQGKYFIKYKKIYCYRNKLIRFYSCLVVLSMFYLDIFRRRRRKQNLLCKKVSKNYKQKYRIRRRRQQRRLILCLVLSKHSLLLIN